MELFEELKKLGVDVDDALKRLSGKEDLYKRLLGLYVKTIEEQYVSPDFSAADYQQEIAKAHSIKGTSGNISVTPMYQAYSKIVELLRADDPEGARTVLQDILPLQNEIVACIRKYQ